MKELEAIKKRIDDLEKRFTEEKEILSFKETCALLGFSEKHLYRLCYENIIPCHNPTGRTLFFLRSELLKWIESRTAVRKHRRELN